MTTTEFYNHLQEGYYELKQQRRKNKQCECCGEARRGEK